MTPETLMVMADGTERPAERIVVGDRLASWTPHGPAGPATVTCSGPGRPRPAQLIQAVHSRLIAADDDLLLVNHRWVRADQVRRGALHLGIGTGGAPSSFSAAHAWAVGVLVGDGYLGASMKLTQSDRRVVDRLRAVLPGTIGGPYNVGGRGNDYGISSSLKPWLRELGLLGKRSADKFIPAPIATGGPDAWWGFLGGWFDTDGTVRLSPRPNASWSTISVQLAHQGKRLLLNLGVVATVVKVRSEYQGRPYFYFQLKVSNAYGMSLLRQHLPLCGIKADRLQQVPHVSSPPGPQNRWPAYGLTRVRRTESAGVQPNWDLETDGDALICQDVVVRPAA